MAEKMHKTIEYTVKKEVSYKELLKTNNGETICAYKQINYINNKKGSSFEGICTLESIEQLTENNSLTNTTKISMFKKDVEDFFRKNNPGTCEFFEQLESYEIKNPYSYIKNNEDWGLYIYKVSSYSLFNYNDEELPKGIFFSYIGAGIDNSNYYLGEMLEVLKKRDDVVFKKGQDKILSIPYYNCDRHTDSYLEFLWVPTIENYKEVIKFKDSFYRYDYIVKNIFGITRKERNDDYDDDNDEIDEL